MNIRDKANLITRGMRQLRTELSEENQRDVISDFLDTAPDDTKARLYDIVMGNAPRPLGATENIGSIAAD